MKAIFFLTTALIAATAVPASAQDQIDQGQASGLPVTGTTRPLGLTQNAWNKYLRDRGESQKRPGYVRYIFDPQQSFPIRTREGMVTTIKLPDGEEIVQAFAGDEAGFQVGIPTPQTIVVKSLFPGVDTNLIAYTQSGKIYTFYMRSDGYNARDISDFLVEIVESGKPGAYSGSQMDVMTPEQLVAYDNENPASVAQRVRDPYATLPAASKSKYAEYAEWTDFSPGTISEDLSVFVPVDQAGGTIPYRVFRDDRFTYIDYGANAAQMTEWPTPLIVIQGVEGPVGSRTAGPGGRLIVIEALGSFVLRNGQRMIIVKPSSDPYDPTLTRYATYDQTPLQVPRDLPPGRPANLPREAKTVVPLPTQPITASDEYPSAVVSITSPKIEAGQDTALAVGTTSVVERSIVDVTPVAKGGGAPIKKTVGTVTTTSTVSPNSVTVTAPGAVPVVAPLAVPLLDNKGYYVTLGTGEQKALEDRWRSAKVQHYDLLMNREAEYIQTAKGTEMRVGPYGTSTEAIALCETMTEQPVCAVKSSR